MGKRAVLFWNEFVRNYGEEEEWTVRNTAYGTYRDGIIFLDSPSSAIDESRVQVIFLNEEAKENSLMEIFDVLGPWEDDRDTETIISEIRNARMSGPDISL
jgi:hypothetical protein